MSLLNNEGLQALWDKIVEALKGKASKNHKHNIEKIETSPGQTIIVKEVDENGKPTKWESADYQPRTHWTEFDEILPETTIECVEMDVDEDGVGDGLFMGALPDILLAEGSECNVIYNGVAYRCKLLKAGEDESTTTYAMGNLGAVTGGENTGEPFIIQFAYNKIDVAWENAILSLDGSASVTLSIVEIKHTHIPTQYVTNAFPYYIEVEHQTTSSVIDDEIYICHDTVKNVKEIYASGREIKVRLTTTGDNPIYAKTILNLCVEGVDANTIVVLGFASGFVYAGTESLILYLLPQDEGTFAVTTSIGGDL